jgi:TolB-like protein
MGTPEKVGEAGRWNPDRTNRIIKCFLSATRLRTGPLADDTQQRLRDVLGDRYEVERELGRGGMATVYLARDIKHDREVAIKVLLPDLAASIGGERFEREIRLAGKLQHPHVLGMYDSGVADGLMYYVMPFIKGESLRDKLDREGQLPVEEAIQITLQVADALGYAHKHGIVHRDIKPENVLMSDGHAQVADFGIARAADEAGQKLTQTGMAIGTPTYMAPEQGMGEKVGPTADLYSLGCMLYEMLAGEPPFTGKTSSGVLAKHVMEQVPSVRIVRSAVPEELEGAIFAAMGKSPADRPQTAEAFVEMLLGAPMGHTATRMATMRHTAARRVPGMYSTQQMAPPRKRWPVLVGITAVMVIGAFAAWRFLGSDGNANSALSAGLDKTTIAVLPFDDLSSQDSLAYLADGLTDGLIAALGRVDGIDVISRGGVDQFRDGQVAPDSIGRALQAGTIVRGDIQQFGDRLRVTIRLIDGTSGGQIKSAPLDLDASNQLAVRDSTAQQVALMIREWLGNEVRLQAQREGTSSQDAWTAYQRGEQRRRTGIALSTEGDTAGFNREFLAADSLFAAAEQLDGDWVDPIISRAELSYQRSRLGGIDPVLAAEWIDKGVVDADRALNKSPNNAAALELRGNLKYWSFLLGLEPNPDRSKALLASAQADLEAATSQPGDHGGAWASLSHLYYYAEGKSLSDVNIAAQRALEEDAFLSNAAVVLDRLFLSSYDLENFPSASQVCTELRRRFPASRNAPRCALFMLTARGEEPDVPRAWRLADSVEAMTPRARVELERRKAHMLVAAVLSKAGLKDSARAVAGRSLGDRGIDPSGDLGQFGAFVSVQLGDTVEAFRRLSVYLAASDRVRLSLAQSPGWWFRPLSTWPEGQRLVGPPQ